MSPLPTALICHFRIKFKTSYPGTRSPCRFNRKEVYPWLDKTLDQTVVLLYQVLQVFELPQFDLLGKDPSSFELNNGLENRSHSYRH